MSEDQAGGEWEDKRGSVPPEGYELWDDEEEKFICVKCDSRLLRIGDYAECTNCGAKFRRSGGVSNDG